MTRLLKLAAIIFTIVSVASAQIVDTLNTPIGPVSQGAKVAVSWSILAGADPTGKFADLSATDSASKNVIDIDPNVPLAPKTYLWQVNVPPGTYFLGINDGSGLKQSGEVVVKAPTGPPPAGGAPPAGGPPAGGTPPAGGAPPAGGSSPPAGGAPPAGGSSPPAGGSSPPAGGSSPPAGGAPPAGGSSPPAGGSSPAAGGSGSGGSSTDTGSSSPTTGSGQPSPISKGSASSIFSGYKVVFSLLGISITMALL